MTKVIPHRKPVKPPRPYREPKPKRYRVEKYIHHYEGDYWYFVEDFHFASNAKRYARLWEEQQQHFKWRVVDTRGEE